MSKYKGQIADFPEEVVEKMLEYQQLHRGKRDVSVFEKFSFDFINGFDWNAAIEGKSFWNRVIMDKNFGLFFSRYPKKNEESIYEVGDTVYWWNRCLKKGNVVAINNYLMYVLFEGDKVKEIFYKDGKHMITDKSPSLSFTPYEMVKEGFSQERPLPNLKKGDLIWVKSQCGEWLYKRFYDWEKKNSKSVIASSQESVDLYGLYSEWSIECPIK